jgi:hypothetical protein
MNCIMGTPEVLDKLFGKIDTLNDKVGQTNLLLEKQNTTVAVLKERKADKAYVDKKLEEHRDRDHGKSSSAPSATIKINGTLLKKIGIILGGTALGGSGVWSLINQITNSMQ